MQQQTEALTGVGALAGQEAQVQRRSNLWSDAFHRLVRNKLAVVGMVMVGLLVFIAIFGPAISPKERDQIYYGHQQEPPSKEF